MSLDLTDDELILVQVMAWCRQATSHYLNECLPTSLIPFGITRPQWVNLSHGEYFRENIKMYLHFLSFSNIAMVQVIEILPLGRQGSFYWAQSIPLLLMTWCHKEPGHQKPWYWPTFPWIFCPQHERHWYSCLIIFFISQHATVMSLAR